MYCEVGALQWCSLPGVMDVAGGIIHDQAEADADTSIQQRLAIGVGESRSPNGLSRSVKYV